jgi:hypothetical protein
MAGFATNNHISETTRISPFFANNRLNPNIDFEPDIQLDKTEESQAHSLTNCLSDIYNLIQSQMSFAQDR